MLTQCKLHLSVATSRVLNLIIESFQSMLATVSWSKFESEVQIYLKLISVAKFEFYDEFHDAIMVEI